MAQPNINNAVHVYSLANSLNEQRKKGLYCDIILKVAGKNLSAHSCVLSACSPYFQSVFDKYPIRPSPDGSLMTLKLDQPGMIGPLVGLKDYGYEAMNCLLDYIYTGKIYWNEYNVNLIVQLADAVMLDELANMGRAYINEINAKICIEDLNNVPTTYFNSNIVNECDKQMKTEEKIELSNQNKVMKRPKLLKRHITRTKTATPSSSDDQRYRQRPDKFSSTLTGNKQFSCRICLRSFRWEHSLNAHLRLHAKMNYYKCKYCEYRTIHKSSFQNHQNVVKCSIAKTNKPAVKQTCV